MMPDPPSPRLWRAGRHGRPTWKDEGSSGPSEPANEPPHFVMIAHEENFQRLRIDAKQEAYLQPSPAFKYILPQPADRDSGMQARLAKALGQDSQCLFRPCHIRVAQVLKRGAKAGAEQDGKFGGFFKNAFASSAGRAVARLRCSSFPDLPNMLIRCSSPVSRSAAHPKQSHFQNTLLATF